MVKYGKMIHYAGFCETFKSELIEITTLDKFQGNTKKLRWCHTLAHVLVPNRLLQEPRVIWRRIITIYFLTIVSISPIGVLQINL